MKFFKCFLILLLYFNVINPSISLLQMKDLYSVLKVEKNFFSPIYGLILSKTSYLKNLYEFGDETSPIVQLVKELFFVHHDQVTFDRTYNPFKPAAFFTPEIIGQLVGHIENYKQDSSEENKEAIKQVINSLVFEGINTEDIDSDMYKNIKIKHSAYNEIDKFTKNIIERLEKEEEALGSSIGRLEEKLKTGLQGTKQEKQQQREKINKEIGVLEPKLQSAREKLQTQRKILSNHEKIKKYLLINTNQLIDSIFSSIEQENITIFENHTIFLFLTFLWEIASTKEEFVKYFEALSNTLQEKSIFKNPDFLTQGKKAFLSSAYTKQNYLDLREEFYRLNLSNFEELIFFTLGFNLYEKFFPKYINMKGNVNYQGEIFSDCGETALLNFFNALLFDPSSGNFNVDILKKLRAKQSIIDFYEKYKSDIFLADTLELHNDWAKIVSGLPNIIYGQRKCNIRAGLANDCGLNNFLNVIKDLIFPDEEIPTDLVFKKLKASLEKIGSPIKIDDFIIEKTVHSIIISINLINQFYKSLKLKLEIFSIHFVLSFLESSIVQIRLIKIINNNLNKIDDFIVQFMMLASLIVLHLDTIGLNSKLWKDVKKTIPSISSYYELFLFFSSVFADNFKINLIGNLLNNKSLKNLNDEYKKSLVKKLYLSLSDDFYIQNKFWNNIFSKDIPTNDLSNLYTLKKMSLAQKLGLIKSVLINNKKDLFYIVEDIFNKLPDNEKIEIIISIIRLNNKEVRMHFKSLINDRIDLKEKNKIITVIEAILFENREEFFSYVRRHIDKIKNAEVKNRIVLRILQGAPDIMREFYPFVKENLPKIRDMIILELCLKNIIISKEKIKAFEPLLQELIKKIETEFSKFQIICSIIKGDPVIMTEQGLYDWAIENIDFITEEKYKFNIFYYISEADPKVMKEKGFFDWVQENKNVFSDEHRIIVDNWLRQYSDKLDKIS